MVSASGRRAVARHFKAGLDITRIEALRRRKRPLFVHHPNSCLPELAYVSLNEDGVLGAGTETHHSGSPPDVFFKRTLRFRITSDASGAELVSLILSDALIELFARVYQGHNVEWDGSNFVGTFSSDAADARDRLYDILDEWHP